LDDLQAEIEKIESGIYDCDAIIEGTATERTENEREESSRKKAELEQGRETKVSERAAILKKLLDNALKEVLPLCGDKKLRQHLQD